MEGKLGDLEKKLVVALNENDRQRRAGLEREKKVKSESVDVEKERDALKGREKLMANHIKRLEGKVRRLQGFVEEGVGLVGVGGKLSVEYSLERGEEGGDYRNELIDMMEVRQIELLSDNGERALRNEEDEGRIKKLKDIVMQQNLMIKKLTAGE